MSYDNISARLMNKFCGFSLWEIYIDDLELLAILSRKKYLYFLCIIRNRPVLNLECERTVQGACLLSLYFQFTNYHYHNTSVLHIKNNTNYIL